MEPSVRVSLRPQNSAVRNTWGPLAGFDHFSCQAPNLSRDSKSVKPVPGTLQEGGAPFQTTHWTLVLRAGQTESSESAQQALSALCETYWPPLYAFLRHRRYAPADAQDLVQAFFLYLFERNTLERADREKGRLRTFLLTSLQNFLINEYDREKAIKRGGDRIILSFDELLPEAEVNMANVPHRMTGLLKLDGIFECNAREQVIFHAASLLGGA